MGGKSRADLLGFLDYLEEKSLVPQATVRARRAAAKKMLDILSEDEAADVTAIDLDKLAHQFNVRHAKDFKPDSLQTYVSRLRSTIADFEKFSANPSAFKPSARTFTRRSQNTSGGQRDREDHGSGFRPPTPPKAGVVVPIPIREDLIVEIRGLPYNLSQEEAKKISAVVMAMAS